ncbi:MAG: hypothetical protein KF857_05915 [Fimbriimonadaceae bacterium]|nr:hypothetical protein [Fimbriimonadaceae bacterium]
MIDGQTLQADQLLKEVVLSSDRPAMADMMFPSASVYVPYHVTVHNNKNFSVGSGDSVTLSSGIFTTDASRKTAYEEDAARFGTPKNVGGWEVYLEETQREGRSTSVLTCYKGLYCLTLVIKHESREANSRDRLSEVVRCLLLSWAPQPSTLEIDGWKLEAVSPNDPMVRTLTKDGNELTILYSKNPTKEALDVFNEMIPAIKARGAEPIELAGMSGYLEVTQLKPNNSTLPTLMVDATLKGPNEILKNKCRNLRNECRNSRKKCRNSKSKWRRSKRECRISKSECRHLWKEVRPFSG